MKNNLHLLLKPLLNKMVQQTKFFRISLVFAAFTALLFFVFATLSFGQAPKVGGINAMYNTLGDSILIKQQNSVFMPELTPFGWSQPVNSAETMINDMKQRKGNGTTADDILKQQQQNAVHGNVAAPPTQAQILAQQQNQLNGRPPDQNEQQKQMQEFSDLMFEISSKSNKYSDQAYYQSSVYKNDLVNYKNTFNKLKDMLEGKTQPSIADAYYFTEAAYGKVPLTYDNYKKIINENTAFIKQWLKENNKSITDPEALHLGTQKFLSDTLYINKGVDGTPKAHAPYFYDYLNYNSDNDRTNYFVTKTLATGGGQCHTLPTNYLITTEGLGVDAFLGYSLSHSFIRYKNGMGNVINYETTIDQILPDQFYLETLPRMAKAMNNKIYITNLNKKQIIASAMIDLAVNYVSEHWLYDKAFIKECMNTASVYFPKEYINDAYNYLNKRIYADEFNSKVKEYKLADVKEIDKYPDVKLAYDNLTNYMKKVNSLGIQNFPESEYMRMMQYYDTKQELQKSNKINGKQPRNLFFNQ